MPAVPADTAVFFLVKKTVAAKCDFRTQNILKFVCSRDFAPDPSGSLQRFPYPLAGVRGSASWQGRKGEGGERREGGKREGREGEHSPTSLLLYFTSKPLMIIMMMNDDDNNDDEGGFGAQ